MISACLTSDDRFVLDIGGNIGEFTYCCGQGGRFALGLDISAGAISMAIARASGAETVAFGVCRLSPDLIGLLPRNDVTLCLSVSHNWHREYGETLTWQMLEFLIARSKSSSSNRQAFNRNMGNTIPISPITMSNRFAVTIFPCFRRPLDLADPHGNLLVEEGLTYIVDWERARSAPILTDFCKLFRQIPGLQPQLTALLQDSSTRKLWRDMRGCSLKILNR